jgi:hypothetical protein
MRTIRVSYIVQNLYPTLKANMAVHHGLVIKRPLSNVTKGSTVLTPDGLGEVIGLIPDWTSSNSRTPSHADVLLYRGYTKRYHIISLEMYFILHNTGKYLKLAPACYRYIYKQDQPVSYRVTKRQYAQMTDLSKAEYAYARTLNKQRGGPQVLKSLSKFGLEIKKIRR